MNSLGAHIVLGVILMCVLILVVGMQFSQMSPNFWQVLGCCMLGFAIAFGYGFYVCARFGFECLAHAAGYVVW